MIVLGRQNGSETLNEILDQICMQIIHSCAQDPASTRTNSGPNPQRLHMCTHSCINCIFVGNGRSAVLRNATKRGIVF